MNETLIIMGSSRSNGETAQSVRELTKNRKAEIVDLLNLKIDFYDYEYKNTGDDFVDVSQKMVNAQTIVFATPVYWYAMSAPMKILFDRFSDLVRVNKTGGRALKGKSVYLLVNGTDDTMPEGFEVPFRNTCKYLDMQYRDSYYLHTGKDDALKDHTWKNLPSFAEKIFAQ